MEKQSEFQLSHALDRLSRTPGVLDALLGDLPDAWTRFSTSADAWSPHEVLGHLIHGEQENWVPRARSILTFGAGRVFTAFDRNGHERLCSEQSTTELLSLFRSVRAASLRTLADLSLSDDDLLLTGTHPEFGEVTLRQLLSTWVAHDLSHIVQISRMLALRYKDEVGPWAAYLSLFRS
jgi:uncharacterized damage-inducible protein DinB